MNHTTEKRITCLDQLNENDTIRLVHNSTGAKFEYKVSKIDRKEKKITLVHEVSEKNPSVGYIEEKSTLTIGADSDDYIFSDNITVWRISESENTSTEKSDVNDGAGDADSRETNDSRHLSESQTVINPFAGMVVKVPVLNIGNPAVLPADFEGRYRLELNDIWKMSLKNGVNDNASLYPIFYHGYVFGVTAVDDRRTVIVRVTPGFNYPVFEATHTYSDGRPYDTNLAISACVIKLISALSYWTTMTTWLALCEPDIRSMFNGHTIPEIIKNIDEIGQTIVKYGLVKRFKRGEDDNDDDDGDENDEDDEVDEADDVSDDESYGESNEALPRVKPWWWTDSKGLI